MEKIIYLVLGGPEESMRKRVEALKMKRAENHGKGKVILDGFSSEINYMREFFPGEFLSYAYSYDTLSNFQRCKGDLEDADVVYIATSLLHWERIRIILRRKFPQVEKKIKWINSGETETKYAKLGLRIYKIFGPTILQKVSIITRWKKYRREYLFFQEYMHSVY